MRLLDFEYRLLAVLFVLYVAIVPVVRVASLLTNIVALGLSLTAAAYAIHSERLELDRLQLLVISCLGLATCWYLLSLSTATFPSFHLSRTKTFVLYIVAVLAGTRVMRGFERTRAVWTVVFAATAGIGVLTLLNLTVGSPIGQPVGPPRTYGPVTIPVPRGLGVRLPGGSYGLFSSMATAIGIAALRWPRTLYPDLDSRSIRVIAAVGLSLLSLNTLALQGRSTFLSMAVVSTVVGLFAIRRYWSRIPLAAKLLLSVGAVVVLTVSIDLVVDVMLSSHTASISQRIEQFEFAIRIIAENPTFGGGAGTYQKQSEFIIHNFWLMMGVWFGLPGLLLWIGVFALAVVRAIRYAASSETRRHVVGVVLLGAIAGGSVELLFYPGFSEALAVLLAVSIGSSLSRPALETRPTYEGLKSGDVERRPSG